MVKKEVSHFCHGKHLPFAYQRLLQRLGISHKFSHWSSAFGFAKGLVFIFTLKQKGAWVWSGRYVDR